MFARDDAGQAFANRSHICQWSSLCQQYSIYDILYHNIQYIKIFYSRTATCLNNMFVKRTLVIHNLVHPVDGYAEDRVFARLALWDISRLARLRRQLLNSRVLAAILEHAAHMGCLCKFDHFLLLRPHAQSALLRVLGTQSATRMLSAVSEQYGPLPTPPPAPSEGRKAGKTFE